MVRPILEGYNLRVLRKFLRRHLPYAGRDGGPSSYKEWQELTLVVPRYKVVPLIEGLSLSDEQMRSELDVLQQKDILRELKRTVPRKGQGLTDARRRSHNKYHREVVTPRKKATRQFMREHPELVSQIKEKHGL